MMKNKMTSINPAGIAVKQILELIEQDQLDEQKVREIITYALELELLLDGMAFIISSPRQLAEAGAKAVGIYEEV